MRPLSSASRALDCATAASRAVATVAVRHARYLALVLPAFALFCTVQAGCSGGASGIYVGKDGKDAKDAKDAGPGVANDDPGCEHYYTYLTYSRTSGYHPSTICDDLGGYGP